MENYESIIRTLCDRAVTHAKEQGDGSWVYTDEEDVSDDETLEGRFHVDVVMTSPPQEMVYGSCVDDSTPPFPAEYNIYHMEAEWTLHDTETGEELFLPDDYEHIVSEYID